MTCRSACIAIALSSVLVVAGCSEHSKNEAVSSSPRNAPVTSKQSSVASADKKIKSPSPIRFEDVTTSSGINHTVASGYESRVFGMPEIAGGGVGAIDIDLDGRVDFAFAGGGHYPDAQSITGYPGALYRGVGNFEFQDITSKTGFDLSSYYNHCVMVDDIDADGFDDVLVTGFGGVQLFMNQGDGTFFRDNRAMGLVDNAWSTAAASADIDSDGLLDIYIAHYGDWSLTNNPPCFSDALPGRPRVTCSPTVFPGIDHLIFKMNDKSVLEDSSRSSHLSKGGRGFGVLCADFDADGDVDIYVTNDEDANYYYVNDGHGVFSESAIQMGCATDPNGESQGSMGLAIGDYQNDAHADILVTNFKNELSALYSARGSRGFRFSTQQAGINKSDPTEIGWGTAFVDLDLNSFEDVIIINGHVDWQDPNFKQMPRIYANENGKFFDINSTAGDYFKSRWPGRGLAIFDENNDGLLDCVVSHLDSPCHVLKNITERQGSYLSVRLIGTQSNRNAIGAIAEIFDGTDSSDQGKTVQLRHMYGGGSFFSTSQRILHFSTPHRDAAGPIKLAIQWPGGRRETLEIDGWNQSIVIVESTQAGIASSWFESQ